MVYVEALRTYGRAVILNLNSSPMRHILLPLLRMVTLLLLLAAMAWPQFALAQTDAELANHYYRYSNPELEAVCARMSPTSHASGLTDGVLLAVPMMGRTYFYQSACYMEMARRTGNLAWCAKVRQRKTLLGDGSAVSLASCQRMVADLAQDKIRMRQSTDSQAVAVQGVFKIASAHAKEQAGGDWILVVQTVGHLAGRYRLEVSNSRDRTRLVAQELNLPQPGDHRLTLPRLQVVGSTALPNIFPIAVSLIYLHPAGSAYANQEHLSNIQNLTLSVQ